MQVKKCHIILYIVYLSLIMVTMALLVGYYLLNTKQRSRKEYTPSGFVHSHIENAIQRSYGPVTNNYFTFEYFFHFVC